MDVFRMIIQGCLNFFLFTFLTFFVCLFVCLFVSHAILSKQIYVKYKIQNNPFLLKSDRYWILDIGHWILEGSLSKSLMQQNTPMLQLLLLKLI